MTKIKVRTSKLPSIIIEFPREDRSAAYLPQAAPASARPTACNSRQIPFFGTHFPLTRGGKMDLLGSPGAWGISSRFHFARWAARHAAGGLFN